MPLMKGFPLEFGIGVRGPEWFYDGAIRWSKKFSDTFSRFDTILAVIDSRPASQPASHVAVAITLNAKASSLKTRPGLVALYDIRPGNGAGPFLQPRSPHGAYYERLRVSVASDDDIE